MTCPRCGSPNVTSMSRTGSRRPRTHRHIIIRQHICGDCAMEFRSFQLAVNSRAVAEAIMDALDVA